MLVLWATVGKWELGVGRFISILLFEPPLFDTLYPHSLFSHDFLLSRMGIPTS